MNPIESLLHTLDLTDTGARTTEDIYTGPSQWMPHGRVYGGQVLAQSLTASMRTVAPDRSVHSMHGYFLRAGDASQEITFAVDRIHDGRSFSTRRTQAYQNGVPILSLIASFQDEDDGLDHQHAAPVGVPQPEDLPSAADLLGDLDHPVAQTWARDRPFDMRHIPSPIYLSVEGEHVDRQAVWMRATSPLPDSPLIHQAALAYASDYTILEPVLRRHGIPWATPGAKIASLDHAMWWHRPARVDDWLLYVQDSPSAVGGRGLSRGAFYTRDGVLVASVAQEGMIRIPSTR
ncbi:acyl-CoA thioesterase-2 [Labedella gwakjiensis]|uniref:Acyl-CoA thioesterase 2 n=1 Tax=Labedella gwakjiensis TaxID=390269 RepID=A0A2P8H0H8_9MICO|nr:acyl-CoA thioesterase II [Labedella gwakjiensis]PSL39723.1 acyl-CoA thioesterase-2 [Labedella gwakjiensis]RUQ85891.1 acyl-CoA thioesterase II [Labedella gwakjiensis]